MITNSQPTHFNSQTLTTIHQLIDFLNSTGSLTSQLLHNQSSIEAILNGFATPPPSWDSNPMKHLYLSHQLAKSLDILNCTNSSLPNPSVGPFSLNREQINNPDLLEYIEAIDKISLKVTACFSRNQLASLQPQFRDLPLSSISTFSPSPSPFPNFKSRTLSNSKTIDTYSSVDDEWDSESRRIKAQGVRGSITRQSSLELSSEQEGIVAQIQTALSDTSVRNISLECPVGYGKTVILLEALRRTPTPYSYIFVASKTVNSSRQWLHQHKLHFETNLFKSYILVGKNQQPQSPYEVQGVRSLQEQIEGQSKCPKGQKHVVFQTYNYSLNPSVYQGKYPCSGNESANSDNCLYVFDESQNLEELAHEMMSLNVRFSFTAVKLTSSLKAKELFFSSKTTSPLTPNLLRIKDSDTSNDLFTFLNNYNFPLTMSSSNRDNYNMLREFKKLFNNLQRKQEGFWNFRGGGSGDQESMGLQVEVLYSSETPSMDNSLVTVTIMTSNSHLQALLTRLPFQTPPIKIPYVPNPTPKCIFISATPPKMFFKLGLVSSTFKSIHCQINERVQLPRCVVVNEKFVANDFNPQQPQTVRGKIKTVLNIVQAVTRRLDQIIESTPKGIVLVSLNNKRVLKQIREQMVVQMGGVGKNIQGYFSVFEDEGDSNILSSGYIASLDNVVVVWIYEWGKFSEATDMPDKIKCIVKIALPICPWKNESTRQKINQFRQFNKGHLILGSMQTKMLKIQTWREKDRTKFIRMLKEQRDQNSFDLKSLPSSQSSPSSPSASQSPEEQSQGEFDEWDGGSGDQDFAQLQPQKVWGYKKHFAPNFVQSINSGSRVGLGGGGSDQSLNLISHYQKLETQTSEYLIYAAELRLQQLYGRILRNTWEHNLIVEGSQRQEQFCQKQQNKSPQSLMLIFSEFYFQKIVKGGDFMKCQLSRKHQHKISKIQTLKDWYSWMDKFQY